MLVFNLLTPSLLLYIFTSATGKGYMKYEYVNIYRYVKIYTNMYKYRQTTY